jgi:hypothetical protein
MNYLFECECRFRQGFKTNSKIFKCKNYYVVKLRKLKSRTQFIKKTKSKFYLSKVWFINFIEPFLYIIYFFLNVIIIIFIIIIIINHLRRWNLKIGL